METSGAVEKRALDLQVVLVSLGGLRWLPIRRKTLWLWVRLETCVRDHAAEPSHSEVASADLRVPGALSSRLLHRDRSDRSAP